MNNIDNKFKSITESNIAKKMWDTHDSDVNSSIIDSPVKEITAFKDSNGRIFESREGAIRSERTRLVTDMLYSLGIRYDRVYNSGDIDNLFLSNMHKIEELVNSYNKLK